VGAIGGEITLLAMAVQGLTASRVARVCGVRGNGVRFGVSSFWPVSGGVTAYGHDLVQAMDTRLDRLKLPFGFQGAWQVVTLGRY